MLVNVEKLTCIFLKKCNILIQRKERHVRTKCRWAKLWAVFVRTESDFTQCQSILDCQKIVLLCTVLVSTEYYSTKCQSMLSLTLRSVSQNVVWLCLVFVNAESLISRLGICSFQKNATFSRSLHSFMFFIKERIVLCILLRSL